MRLSDIVAFIINNRGNTDACKDWDVKTIAAEVVTAIQNKSFAVDVDAISNKILGIVIAEPRLDDKVLHIKSIICLRGGHGTIKRFLQVFKNKYPDFTISALRNNGNLTQYNTKRLVKLMELKAL